MVEMQDATALLETHDSSGYVMPFDNTNGNMAGIALANLTSQTLVIPVTRYSLMGGKIRVVRSQKPGNADGLWGGGGIFR